MSVVSKGKRYGHHDAVLDIINHPSILYRTIINHPSILYIIYKDFAIFPSTKVLSLPVSLFYIFVIHAHPHIYTKQVCPIQRTNGISASLCLRLMGALSTATVAIPARKTPRGCTWSRERETSGRWYCTWEAEVEEVEEESHKA